MAVLAGAIAELDGRSASRLRGPVELLSVGFNGLLAVVRRTRVSWLVTSRLVSVVDVVVLRLEPLADLFSCSMGERTAEAGRLFFCRNAAEVLRSAKFAVREGGSDDIATRDHFQYIQRMSYSPRICCFP